MHDPGQSQCLADDTRLGDATLTAAIVRKHFSVVLIWAKQGMKQQAIPH